MRPPETILRVAESKDGLAFVDAGKVFLRDASSPGLVRLPNGGLLAIFDQGMGSSENRTVMAVSRSSDDGRTWSRSQAIRFAGPGAPARRCGHGELVIMPNKVLRLYFTAVVGGKGDKGDPAKRDACRILSAVSRNGLAYTLDRDVEIPLDGGADACATVAASDKKIDLYVDGSGDCGGKGDGGGALHLTSSDGRRFRPLPAARTSGLCFTGSIVPADERYRAYVTGAEGVCSMVSKDGVVWTKEDGIRLARAFDPAVVRLKDGTYLMLYCAEADDRSRRAPQVALVGSAARGDSSQSSTPPALPYEGGEARGESSQGSTPSSPPSQGGDVGGADGWESFAPDSAETAGGSPGSGGGISGLAQPADGSGTSGSAAGEASGQDAQSGGDLLPPKADFSNPVDYHAWLQEQFPVNIENNAFDAYAAMMPQSLPGGQRPAWWPETINDMFNGDYSGPIGPWSPAEHADWESTHQVMEPALSAFREAARIPNYACPFMFEPNNAGGPDGGHLVAEYLLPSLGCQRTMVKATLADAWRAENGQVSPERMTDAFETCLRSAGHMEQGFSVIHQLVGVAEQSLTEENARTALAQNVFQTPEQIESALNVLRTHDQRTADPSRWLALEQVSNMDALQYCFSPGGPAGQPQLNVERARYAMGIYHGEDPAAAEEELSRAAQIPPQDVQTAVDTLNAHYRGLAEMWRTGYPQVTADDIGRFEDRNAHTNEITKTILPSLSRAYELMTRNEASRRGTQLTFAVHLFKARNGRWPASLDELPPELGDTMKTDPFTGGRFAYRVTESGPTIYSLSRNGVDDGGVHSAKWGDVEGEQSDDFVFWPAQPRK